MSCVPVGPKVRVKASSPGELEETKRRLNEVVEIGAQFATLRQDPRVPSLASRLLLRRQALTETKVLAKVTVTIKGQQLGDNGAPKLVDMGWVFKWTPVVNDPNTRMEVNCSPTVGIHNIIHDQSPVTVDQANFDPHVEAKGIVSFGLGSWIQKKTQTIRRFTTFSLACTPTDGQVKWQWHQT